jgi:hypothetical protein
MAIKPIGLSFKDTPEDIELYGWIKSHSNLSGFIKDTLRAVKENESPKKESKSCEGNKTELIDMDF